MKEINLGDYFDSPKRGEGYTLSWSNLSYTLPSVTILSDLNGIVYPGSLTAVLGASGSGKSSFLDVIAGRVNPSFVSGDIRINHSNKIPMREASRYCTQEEALFSMLTVYETLLYAAHFNLPSSYLLSEKECEVEILLRDFGLEKVRNTIIGGPLLKGCSGGQVRRVSVASQVVGMKSGILLLDEPTSGLDSVAAYAVMNSVCNLARKEKATIIVTIHQPSTEMFELFSHLLLLAEGKTVYFGEREEAISHFEQIGHPVPIRANPSDAYLSLTSTDFNTNKEGKPTIAFLTDMFSRSEYNQRMLAEIGKFGNSDKETEITPLSNNTGFPFQTKILAKRAFLNAARNPVAYWVRVVMYVALAILMGTTWMRMGLDQRTVQDRMAGVFYAVAFMSFMAIAGIPAFLEERHVFMRECANGLYSVEAYLLSNFIVSIPFILIINLGFSSIAYFSMGLQETPEKFLNFVGIFFLFLMIAEAQTVFISIAIPIFVAALAVTAVTNGLWMAVQGFFVQKKNIPSFWYYSFHQIDFQKYAYELLVTNEFTGLTFTCNEFQFQGDNQTCVCVIPSKDSRNCTFTGEDVLSYYDYEDIPCRTWWGYMFAIFLVFKIGTYIFLKIRMRRNVY